MREREKDCTLNFLRRRETVEHVSRKRIPSGNVSRHRRPRTLTNPVSYAYTCAATLRWTYAELSPERAESAVAIVQWSTFALILRAFVLHGAPRYRAFHQPMFLLIVYRKRTTERRTAVLTFDDSLTHSLARCIPTFIRAGSRALPLGL